MVAFAQTHPKVYCFLWTLCKPCCRLFILRSLSFFLCIACGNVDASSLPFLSARCQVCPASPASTVMFDLLPFVMSSISFLLLVVVVWFFGLYFTFVCCLSRFGSFMVLLVACYLPIWLFVAIVLSLLLVRCRFSFTVSLGWSVPLLLWMNSVYPGALAHVFDRPDFIPLVMLICIASIVCGVCVVVCELTGQGSWKEWNAIENSLQSLITIPNSKLKLQHFAGRELESCFLASCSSLSFCLPACVHVCVCAFAFFRHQLLSSLSSSLLPLDWIANLYLSSLTLSKPQVWKEWMLDGDGVMCMLSFSEFAFFFMFSQFCDQCIHFGSLFCHLPFPSSFASSSPMYWISASWLTVFVALLRLFLIRFILCCFFFFLQAFYRVWDSYKLVATLLIGFWRNIWFVVAMGAGFPLSQLALLHSSLALSLCFLHFLFLMLFSFDFRLLCMHSHTAFQLALAISHGHYSVHNGYLRLTLNGHWYCLSSVRNFWAAGFLRLSCCLCLWVKGGHAEQKRRYWKGIRSVCSLPCRADGNRHRVGADDRQAVSSLCFFYICLLTKNAAVPTISTILSFVVAFCVCLVRWLEWLLGLDWLICGFVFVVLFPVRDLVPAPPLWSRISRASRCLSSVSLLRSFFRFVSWAGAILECPFSSSSASISD